MSKREQVMYNGHGKRSYPTARRRPRYNRDGWPLCICQNCGRYNYVEPHGTTAKCACSKEWQEHKNTPFTDERWTPAQVNLEAQHEREQENQ